MANFQNERELLAQLEDLFRQKQFAAGLVQADAVLSQFPASFHLKFLKFKFLRELQKTDEALFLLREMHAMFGDNIMVLKELADLHFRQQQFPESLVYYKKLLFLDSFNSQAQERVRHLQGILEDGVVQELADTKIESRPVAAPAAEPPLVVVEEPAPRAVLEEAGGSAEKAQEPSPPEPNAGGEEAPFQTESAAELYFKQGLYAEALAVYKSLFEKTGRNDFFLKIKAILMLQRSERGSRVIERLQRFLQVIQQRSGEIV